MMIYYLQKIVNECIGKVAMGINCFGTHLKDFKGENEMITLGLQKDL